jgi:glycosyltransferase involved in cell wall biosynthesis
MRIGIMLRAIGEKGGIGIYTRHITRELIELGQEHEFILLYADPSDPGRFAKYPNVTERYLNAPNKAVWDQICVPRAYRKEKMDVLFHPKFTVPLLSRCTSVMVLHGAGWFIPEFMKFWKKADLCYLRVMMPLYCRKAAVVLSVSDITRDIFNRVFHLPPGKIRTVYFAAGRQFRRVTDQEQLENIKKKYLLPDRFIFTLSGYDRGDRKNISGILGAFRLHYGKTPHHLVIGGKDCHKFTEQYGIPEDEYGKDIHFLGWIEQEDLPAIYSLADLFLYPSHMEAFPVPITEALACGTPIITSNANGLREIVGDAACLVDPTDVEGIGVAVAHLLDDVEERKRYSEKALERSRRYSWDKCARETLNFLEEAGSHGLSRESRAVQLR